MNKEQRDTEEGGDSRCVPPRHAQRHSARPIEGAGDPTEGEQVAYDPVHYLAVLERKPGALDFAAPLEGWELPVCFGVLRRRLVAEFAGAGTRRYIKVLRLLESASPAELTRAVERALEL